MVDDQLSDKEPKVGYTRFEGALPKKGYLLDAVQVYNARTLAYDPAWEHRFNKRCHVEFFKLTNAYETGPVWGKKFYCAPYRWATVFFNLSDTVGAPDRLLILAWFSWDGVTWFQHMEDAWGRMQWEDTDLPSLESYPIPILAPWITFTYGVTTGAVGTKYFPLRIEAVFNSV